MAGTLRWPAEMVVTAAASGEQAVALAAAERAKELAIGDNQTQCEKLIEKIKQGEHASWAP